MIASGRVLDRLPAEEPCLGALFTSYTFDPAFFEDHVLRAVLRLSSDPVEHPERYHHEARRALQETPVIAIVDSGERQPGRRLPFDLLEVSEVVFHPKSVLLLYRKFARVQIGSGNLTYAGYGGNTELFFCRDLAYGNEIDAALLAAFNGHFKRICGLVRNTGTQLELFQQELRRRMRTVSSKSRTGSVALLDSTSGPILEQFSALLPESAVIESVGMLAPFYERDDVGFDAASVFSSLAPRLGTEPVLDVGVAWNNPEIRCSGDSELEQGLDHLWTWAWDNEGTCELKHLVPISTGPKMLTYLDESGQRRRCPLDVVFQEIEDRNLWMQPTPQAFAPPNAVVAARAQFPKVRIWLHPSTRLVDGQPSHRPLHAKLLTASFLAGSSRGTLVLMGSPNMSRRALLMPAGAGSGNVELACAFRVDADLSLRDLVHELVCVPRSALILQDREFPELERNWSLAIDKASHDPRGRSLVVTWSPVATALTGWSLSYEGEPIAGSTTAPTEPVTVSDFVLSPSTAELVLHVNSREYPVSILVMDLSALPATPDGTEMGLDELILLLGHSINVERAAKIAARRAPGGNGGKNPDAFFGEGFVPTDVFRAWWSIARELQDADLSVQAVRVRLEGALGVEAAWTSMLDALKQKSLSSEKVWFYGAELLRTLTGIELPQAEDRAAKAELIEGFRKRVRKDLENLNFDDQGRAWLSSVFDFYGRSDT